MMRTALRRACLSLATVLVAGVIARPSWGQPAVAFLPPITYERPIAVPLAGADGVPLITADLDGDGRLDVVVFTADGISLLYGNGDGTLGASVDYPLGQSLQEGTAADLNGDGLLDLVICHRGLRKLAILLNRGGRTFAPAINLPLNTELLGVVAGDFNGDGAPDLAVAAAGASAVMVLINRKDGTFQPPVSYGGILVPTTIVPVDLDGDGALDLAVASLTGNVIHVLLGDGKGKFKVGGKYTTGAGYANRMVSDDFDGDGIPDLAVANLGTLSLMFGDGSGHFGVPTLYDGYHLLDKGDFDGDGAVDLITPGRRAGVGGFFLHMNREAGNFLPPMLIAGPGDVTGGVRVGDFNGDGRPDVVAWNEGSPHLAVYLNNTPRATPAIRSLTLTPNTLVAGCDEVRGTVSLTSAAPADGLVVALRSTNPAIQPPSTVKLDGGQTTATFPVAIGNVAGPQAASILATYMESGKRAALRVRAPGVVSLTLSSASVTGGQSLTGEVVLRCPAEPNGVMILLTTSNAAVAQLPAAVLVAGGASSGTFSVTTRPVDILTTVVISARIDDQAVTAALEVRPAPTPTPVPPPPLAPNAATGLSATAVSAAEIQLRWQDNSGDEVAFVLYRQIPGGSYERIASLPANSTSYLDRGLRPGTTYRYLVLAWSPKGGASHRSNEATATTPLAQ